jgi:flagellar motor protein MotB
MKSVAVVAVLGLLLVGTGCQNWKQKHETCTAEKDNLEALFENCQESLQQCNAERDQMATSLGQTQKDLAEAMKKKTFDPGFAGEDAKWDPAKGTITVPLASDVLFDSGRVTLKSDSKSRLNRIAQEIKKKYGSKEVSVIGHTDTDPIKKSKWQDNWQLSTERALAVTRYLIQEGISAKQLAAVGRSEYHPIGSKKSDNRRVEIVVHMFD